MNYDHRFHAGNFADVFKHVVLTRILLYLQRKPTPFRVIDTHAGSGLYDLGTDAASRTLEWKTGLGRLDPDAFSSEARSLIEPYLQVVGAAAPGATPYPGSPMISLRLLRPFDRTIFCELHPAAFAALKSCIARDRRAKAVSLDGYMALKAFIPPVERRGLVLIDPPFEAQDEFERLGDAILAAHAKWREGILVAWYPIKDRRGVEGLSTRIGKAQIADVLRLQLDVGEPRIDGPLVASGLLVVNPPFSLEAEMACLLPELRRQLDLGGGGWRIDRLAG